jgi:hypothetical protein
MVATLAAGCSSNAAPQVAPTTGALPAAPSTTLAPLGPAVPETTLLVKSTTSSPVDPAVVQAVKQGVHDFFAAYMACGQAPAECHPADFHSERGTAVGQGTVYFQGLAARGEYFGPDLRGSYMVTQSVAFDDPKSAVAFSCWYDASILLGPPDSGGQPTVLNDKIISVRYKQSLYFNGTDWKVGEAAPVEDLGDGNQCPPPELTG